MHWAGNRRQIQIHESLREPFPVTNLIQFTKELTLIILVDEYSLKPRYNLHLWGPNHAKTRRNCTDGKKRCPIKTRRLRISAQRHADHNLGELPAPHILRLGWRREHHHQDRENGQHSNQRSASVGLGWRRGNRPRGLKTTLNQNKPHNRHMSSARWKSLHSFNEDSVILRQQEVIYT